MGSAILRLFCSGMYWRRGDKIAIANLKFKQANKDMTKKLLQTVFYELDKNTFLRMIDTLLSKLQKHPDTKILSVII